MLKEMTARYFLTRLVFLGISCLLINFNLKAAEWEVSSDIKQVLGYDDNVTMREERVGSFEYLLTPRLDFIRRDQNLDASFHASYGLQRYPDVERLDYEPQDYGANLSYRTARTRWQLNGSYSDKLSRNFAVLETGDFSSAASRTNWSLAPQFTYLVSPTDSLNLGFNYYETEYSATFSSNKGKSVNLGWQRQWRPTFSQGISVFYSNNQFEGVASSTTDSYGLNVTSNYKISKLWSVAGTIGGRVSEVTINDGVNIADTAQSVGFLGDLELSYRDEFYLSTLSLGQSLAPSGQGRLRQQAHFSWNGSYKFSKRLNAGLDVSYKITSTVGAANSSADAANLSRNNFQIKPSLNWAVTPEINAELSYRYRQQEKTFTADSNLIMLTINFDWMGYKLSR